MSAFIKSLRAHVRREYKTQRMGFLWAREQEKAKGQHYHLVLLLDGDVVRHPSALITKIGELWRGHPYTPKNCYVLINDDATKREAIHRASYLAKPRGKGYQGANARNFGASRIKPLPSVGDC